MCIRDRDYRCPSEADAGEVVTFYFRTEKNGADAVVLLECDPETGALLQEWQMKRLSWECCAGSVGNGADTNRAIDGSGMADKSDSRFDYYSCALTLGTKTFSYVFQVTWGAVSYTHLDRQRGKTHHRRMLCQGKTDHSRSRGCPSFLLCPADGEREDRSG